MSKQFLTEQNLNILFNMMKEYIYKKEQYEINQPEWDFLVQVMKKSYDPMYSLQTLNKKTLDHVIPVIMNKLKNRYQEQTLPTINVNQDVEQTYQQIVQSRKPIDNTPTPIKFTEHEQEYQPIQTTPSDIIKLRALDTQITVPFNKNIAQQFSQNKHTDIIEESKHVETLGTQVLQSREFKTLQPEPQEYKEFYNKEKNDLLYQEYIVIDSRDRNHVDYVNPNNYRIDLEKDLNDVVAIELISAEVPKSEYVINANNNKIYFQETNAQVSGNTYLTATLSVGNYTLAELKTEIETQMDTVGIANYTVTIISKTNNINISSNLSGVTLFNLLFKGNNEIHGHNNNPRSTYLENSIGPVIGFSRIDRTGSSNYTGDLQYNLNGEKYIMLHLANIPMIEGISDGIQNAFHKITLNSDNNTTRYYKEGEYKISKKLNNPIKRLNELEISFRNYNNDLYDFHGLEHSLTFKITSIKGKTI